ncbi:hypothetical protein NBRC111894_837 [Sporolactobacillus inulinus]|uniref:Glyoxalase/fosfomycin resistance/dioxygenase domain-containing protein n=1 Tax=Sporolactobacillus inulinus TaxID=2078 RepID=A0A4Y1Z8D3_9BACL|nr:hypothetical protein NBRC111894_837 [Sporolactobacillus inulinus]
MPLQANEQTMIKRVSLKVNNLVKMIEFYSKTIGLRLIKQSQTQALFSAQGSDQAILQLKKINDGTSSLAKPVSIISLFCCLREKISVRYCCGF